jgi:hypothetical protein
VIRHLLIIAIGFRLAGVLLGVASIAALADPADTALTMRRTPPPDMGTPLEIKTYGLVGLLSNAARGIGYGLHALARLLDIMLAILAVAAVFALLFAVLLYLTGRGIGHHATWARIIAILIAAGVAFTSCAIMTVLQREQAPFAALPIGGSAYALWVLIWRFS